MDDKVDMIIAVVLVGLVVWGIAIATIAFIIKIKGS